MADNKITKEDLKKPDAFVRTMEQSWSFTTRYGKPIAAALGVVLLLVLGMLIMNSINERKEKSAVQALYKPQSEYLKLKEQYDGAKSPAAPQPGEAAAAKAVPASGDLEKDFGSVIPEFEKVISEHSGTVAAGQAGVYLASIYQSYGKLDEAKKAIEVPLKGLKQGTLMHSVAQLVNGNIHASQGNCQEAVASYEKVSNFLSLDAAVKAGVCYEKLNQFDRAAEMYKRATEGPKESSTALAAKGLLRALEQKRQTQSPNQAG